ncbi:unnamed protein product, partial [Sphacelaria rigidula]
MGYDSPAQLCILGNVVVKPKSRSYVLAIIGPSNAGKSALLRQLSEVMNGACCSINSRVITKGTAIGEDEVMILSSDRLALAVDVEHNNGNGFSTPSLRILTGGDSIVGRGST